MLDGLRFRPPQGELFPNDPFAAPSEDVGRPLEEQYPKHVLLELGCVHLAAEDVGRGEQVALELPEGEFLHEDALNRRST